MPNKARRYTGPTTYVRPSYMALYKQAEYQRQRGVFLSKEENLLCAICRKAITTVLDHKIPHRGSLDLFWDQSNWQGLCKSCHNHKSRSEREGK